MPIYTSGQTGSEIITSSETQPTFNEKLSASISEAWSTSYGPKLYDFGKSVIAGENGPRLSKEQATKQIEDAGLGAHMSADDGKYTADQLNVLIDRQKRILSAQDIASRTDWDIASPIRGLAAFGAGILDPINVASAVFPATKLFQAARLGFAVKGMTALERASVASPSLLGRLGARAGVGAVEGAVGTAVLEPANYWLSQQLQDDYGMADSLMNLAAGTAFGAGFGGVAGLAGESVRAFRNRMSTSRVAIEAAVNEQLGIPPVAPDYQVKAGSETWVRMGDNDVPAQWAVVDAKDVQARAARAATPETVQAITQGLDFNRMADAATMGEGAPVIGRNGELLAGTNRVAALDELYNAGNADGYKAPLAEKLKELGIDETVLNEMQQPMLVRMLLQDVEPEQVAKFKDELAPETPSPKQATADENIAKPVGAEPPAISETTLQEPPAAELVAKVSPETREAASKVAVGEMIEGKRPQVDALIKQDPAIAKATPADVASDVRKANDIANEYTSDVDAARYVEKQAAKEIPEGELADLDLPRLAKERAAIAKETDELIKRIEADIDSPLYSVQRETIKATDGTPDMAPVEQLTETLRTEFGKATEALIDTGKVLIVNSIDELPGGPHPERVQAVYIGGKVYMVASNINPAKARGLLLHEVGVHAGMENMLGADGFAKVLDQVDRLVAEDDDLARIARASVPADTPAAHVREEMLAYLVENAPQLPLVQKIIAAVRAWAYRTFGVARDSMELTGADLVQLATASLRKYARGAADEMRATRYAQELANQTESKAFQDWFGDSKVVDENGKPLVVYHGTKADFAGFDKKTIGSNTGNAGHYGKGFYFSSSASEASGYAGGSGGNVMPVYLDIKKPFDATNATDVAKFAEHLGFSKSDIAVDHDWLVKNLTAKDAVAGKFADIYLKDGKQAAWAYIRDNNLDATAIDLNDLQDILSHSQDDGEMPDWMISTIEDATGSKPQTVQDFVDLPPLHHLTELGDNELATKLTEWAKANGYDGIVAGSEYVAFEPSQVKSVFNRGTFDPNNPDIRYSVTPATFDKEAFKKEMAVFAEAEQRAEGYGAALRAAFNVAGNVDAMIKDMRQAMPELSLAEAEQLANKFNRKVTTFQRELDEGRVPDYAIGLDPRERAAQAITDDTLYKLALEKRATVFAHRAKMKGIDLVTNNFAGVEDQGVQALLVGSNLARKGARSSVAASQQHWSNRYIGGLTTKLNEAGLYEAFVSDAFGDDIMRAMEKLERGDDVSKLAKEAVGIAKIVREFYDASVQDRNQRGTWIRKTKGYFFDQSYAHDMARIRGAGAAEWKQDAMQWFDFDEMARRQDLTPRQVMTELDKMWSDFASGSHMKFTDDTQTNNLANMLGGANVAKQESKSRVIVFKDAEAAIGYFKKYGSGEFKSAVYSSLDKAARQIGLMDVLGPKYENTLKAILDTAEETITDPEAKNKFHTTTKNKAEAWLEMLDGRANIPVNGTLARRAALVRGWIRLTSLGGSIFAQFSDLANIAAELKFLGSPKGYLGNVADAVGSFAKRYKGTEREAMINALGVYNEAATAAAFESSGANDLMGGMMAKASQLFFKLNLQSPWTYKLRLHMADTLMNYMGTMTKEDFGALPKHLQTMLKGYNITEREWGLLRQLDQRAIDGRNYLDPNKIDSIDTQVREMVSRELGTADAKAIDEAASRVKGNLKTALSNFYLDSVSRGMLEPDIRSRAILVGNTRPGTIQGEILRMIGQFKLFPVGAVINIMGREVYSRGFDSIGDFIRRGKGEMLGMAQYMLAATTMGYMTMMAKDLTKGRTPRDPTSPSTWAAAFIAGGAAGIYGDFLFGEYNRFGTTLTGTLAGPFFSKADDIMKLYGSARGWFTGDVDSVDFASKLLRFGINNTPMINLFYTRFALDYLFLYGLQENMNPGYLRRMERNVQQQNNQTFWLPPSQYALGVR